MTASSRTPVSSRKGDTRITLLASALDRAATGIARACDALARGERRQVSKTAILGELAQAIAGPRHDWAFLKNRPADSDGIQRFVQPGLENVPSAAPNSTPSSAPGTVPATAWVVEIDVEEGWAYPSSLFLSRAAALDFVRRNALWQKQGARLAEILAALEARGRFVSDESPRMRIQIRELDIHPGTDTAEPAARQILLDQARIEARVDFLLASQGSDIEQAIAEAGLDPEAVERALDVAVERFIALRRDFLLSHLGRDGFVLVREMILSDGDWSILSEVIAEMAEAGEGNTGGWEGFAHGYGDADGADNDGVDDDGANTRGTDAHAAFDQAMSALEGSAAGKDRAVAPMIVVTDGPGLSGFAGPLTLWQRAVLHGWMPGAAKLEPGQALGQVPALLALDHYFRRCMDAISGFSDADGPDEPSATLTRLAEEFAADSAAHRGTERGTGPAIAMGRARTAAADCWRLDSDHRLAVRR